MRWFYEFVRFWSKTAYIFFFKSFKYSGYDKIDWSKPTILCPNHQNAFLDAVTVATANKGVTSFLVRADVFKNPSARKFLETLYMMPIYRMRDGRETLEKNDEIFEKCYDVIESGKTLLIFPEGSHEAFHHLRPLRKGVSRIAFGAVEKHPHLEDLQLIPVGINYGHFFRMRQPIYIRLGNPVKLKDYLEDYKENQPRAMNKLRMDVEAEMRKELIDFPSKKEYPIVKMIGKIKEQEGKLGRYPVRNERDFESWKDHIKKCSEKLDSDDQYRDEIFNHHKDMEHILKEHGIREEAIWKKKNSLFKQILMVLAAPLWLFGMINNYLPYKIPAWLMLKKVKDDGFKASILLTFSMVLFPIFYFIQFFVVAVVFDSWWIALSYLIVGPFCGLVAYWFYREWMKTINRWKYYNLLKGHPTLVEKDQRIREMAMEV